MGSCRATASALVLFWFVVGALMGHFFVTPWLVPWLKEQVAQVQREQDRRTKFAYKCGRSGGEVHNVKDVGFVCELPDGTLRSRL